MVSGAVTRALADHPETLDERSRQPGVSPPSADGVARIRTAYCRRTESSRLPSAGSTAMADKSPRQHMAKKASRSIKEKRADKHAKAEAKNHLDIGEIRKK